jgi:hypothetical protein
MVMRMLSNGSDDDMPAMSGVGIWSQIQASRSQAHHVPFVEGVVVVSRGGCWREKGGRTLAKNFAS